MSAPEILVDVTLGPLRVVAHGEDLPEPKRIKNWTAIQRMAARPPRVLEAHRGRRLRASYDAGQVSRINAQWGISTGNANRELRGTLVNLRARSRDLERNDPYAKKFLEMVEGNVVGASGISVQSRASDPGTKDNDFKPVQDKAANSILEREFAAFGRAGEFEVTGKLSRSAFERLLVRTVARDGEVLVKHVADPASRHGIRYQMLEADWLDEGYNADLANGNRVVMGVELNPSGRPVAYHLRTVHPGDSKRGSGERVRYSADRMKHYFIAERPEQVRGVPWMHAAMSRLYQLGEFDDAAILAARLGADKFMFLEDVDGTAHEMADGTLPTESGGDEGGLFFNSQKGSIDILPRGTKIADWNPNYPSDTYGPFVLAALRGVASGFGISYESLSNDRNGVTWTSIRHAVLDERDHWKALQAWLIESYAWDTYTAWLDSALLAPQRPLAYLPPGKRDKFLSPVFHGRRWDWVNPKDDIEAKEKALNLRLTSHRRVLAEQGVDLEELFGEIQDDAALAATYGITLASSAQAAPDAAAPPDTDAEDSTVPPARRARRNTQAGAQPK